MLLSGSRLFTWATFALLNISVHAGAQDIKLSPGSHGTQWGVAAKFSLETDHEWHPIFRIGLSGGIGRFIGGSTYFPSLHADIMFYNNGFGSAKNVQKKPAIVPDFMISATITKGWENRLRLSSSKRPGIRNPPLYYFSNFTRPPLQNPYNYSFSFGSNIAFNPTHKHPFQRIGFFNLHIGQIQFSYFNDGTPFQWTKQGDGFDRYYTGGGIISFTIQAHNVFDNYELSYHKYSGYTKDAFEIANLLDLSFLNYGDDNENSYNKSMFTLSATSSTHHLQVGVSAFNQTDWDIQHRIHRHIFNAYHRVPHKAYVTPRASLYISNTKIFMK